MVIFPLALPDAHGAGKMYYEQNLRRPPTDWASYICSPEGRGNSVAGLAVWLICGKRKLQAWRSAHGQCLNCAMTHCRS